ncbi:MAG: hypothetical protein ACE5DN_04870, partial [Flavobacteriales bacterium]
MKTKLLTIFSAFATMLTTALPAQIDTITTYLDRSTGYNLETASGGGYKFGTGYVIGNLVTGETGMHYSSVGAATVLELLVWFGNVHINSTPDILTANVYDVSSDSMPNNLLGSGQLSTGAINANPNTLTYTPISITTGGGINGDFFVSLDYENFDDTIGIMTNDPTANDGQGEHRLRQKELLFNQWRHPNVIWLAPYDADVMIIPVLDIGNGISDVHINGVQILSAFPNPASDEINLLLELKKSASLTVNVFDLSGKTVWQKKALKL